MYRNPSTAASKTCRTCMVEITDTSQSLHLDAVGPELIQTTVRERLSTCVPELNLDDLFGVVICSHCGTALDFFYRFKRKCLDSEERLRKRLVEQSERLCSQAVEEVSSTSNDNCIDKIAQPHLEMVDIDLVSFNDDAKIANDVEIIEDEDENGAKLPSTDNTSWLTAYTVPETEDVQIIEDGDTNSSAGSSTTPRYIISSDEPVKTFYKCCDCDYVASVKTDIEDHVKTHRGESANNKATASYSILRKVRISNAGVKSYHVCIKCGFSTSSESAMISHMESHNSRKEKEYFSCKQCKFCTVDIQYMDRHMASHGLDNAFVCDKCNYSAPNKNRLKLHKRYQHANSNLKCSKCSFTAISKTGLASHNRRTHKPKEFKCTKCNDIFLSLDCLRAHNKMHRVKSPDVVCLD